jgi:hypothetical protein
VKRQVGETRSKGRTGGEEERRRGGEEERRRMSSSTAVMLFALVNPLRRSEAAVAVRLRERG